MSNRLISLFAALFITLAGPAALADRTTGEALDDSTVQAAVKAALADSDAVKASSINLETYKGNVLLGGFVDTEAERAAAEQVAKSVDGVAKVTNGLVVSEPDRSMGQVLDDQTIETKVKAALMSDEVADAREVNVEVRRNVVLLTGFTESTEEKARAGEVARGVKDVKDVANMIVVKPQD
jgi:hyperosmotically inducible protein